MKKVKTMDNNTKISIRFFNDREVRAIWDEENNKWWFNVIDIVSILNEQDDYTKKRPEYSELGDNIYYKASRKITLINR